MIVEDNPADAELIRRALEQRNLARSLLVLKDGAEAADFFFAGRAPGAAAAPKVIVLDWRLPKVSGVELLGRLKSDERTRRIPVVVLTVSGEEPDLKAAYALGVNSYVTKPANSDEFATAVAKLGLYWLTLNKACEQ